MGFIAFPRVFGGGFSGFGRGLARKAWMLACVLFLIMWRVEGVKYEVYPQMDADDGGNSICVFCDICG
jgi:hypothetical protein